MTSNQLQHQHNYSQPYNQSEVIDLSIKSQSILSQRDGQEDPLPGTSTNHLKIFKPQPRPAWAFLWYQTIWPKLFQFQNNTSNNSQIPSFSQSTYSSTIPYFSKEIKNHQYYQQTLPTGVDLTIRSSKVMQDIDDTELPSMKDSFEGSQHYPIMDIAACDGPVQFQRISNPNFALTVEHCENIEIYPESDEMDESPIPTIHSPSQSGSSLISKTYLCIYCNQTFKSLFCYQKHKKRHLNPVSVDITTPHSRRKEITHSISPENNMIRTTDLNVQFFPCKKCGSKFPSYYFVHKHKKLCDLVGDDETAVQLTTSQIDPHLHIQ